MSLLNPFRKNKKPPKEVEKVFEEMRVGLEGRKLADEAISYRNLGEYNKALRLLMDALEKYGYKPAITLIGTTALLKGDIEGAIKWFETNIKDHPKDEDGLLIEWYGNLGVIYLYKKEDWKTARVICERALNIPKPPKISDEQYEFMISLVHRDVAVAYLACGEITLALDFARKRLAFDPNDDSSKKVISMCLAQKNSSSLNYHLINNPSCGAVIFSSDGKATQIAAGGTVFASPFQRLIHGMGHILLHDIYNATVNALPEYRIEAQNDVVVIEAWAGVINRKWTDEQEERFAHQVEIYLSKKGAYSSLVISPDQQLDSAISKIIEKHLPGL